MGKEICQGNRMQGLRMIVLSAQNMEKLYDIKIIQKDTWIYHEIKHF